MKKIKKKRKLVIGITGGFGTGKSTVASFLRSKGFGVFDADRIAHETLQATHPVFQKICEKFPEAMTNGFLDRSRLADAVFKSPKKLKRLERLIHPYVMKRLMAEIKKCKKKFIAIEVPLLFEAGFHKISDLVLVVNASIPDSEKRLVAQGWTRTEIKRRRRAQWPMHKKMARADFVVHNAGSKAETKQQVQNFLKSLTEKNNRGN